MASFNMGIYSATKNEQIEVNSAGIIAIPPSVPPPDEALLNVKKPVGFASTLVRTALGEDLGDNQLSGLSQGATSENIEITDEELALLGPPWAKEGILSHRCYKESPEKGTKSETWMDVFAVVQKGELLMFKFGNYGTESGGPVGDGRWWENAKPVGELQLAHSIAQARPPSNHNNQRPNCVALTLAGGSVYFFQAGTDELMNEWVSTCNYWAARRSKELSGSNTNVEYGWNRILFNPESGNTTADLASVKSDAGRSVVSFRNQRQPRTARSIIHEWKPPMSSIIASTRNERDQLEAMENHVSFLGAKLEEHFQLLQPMIALHKSYSGDALKARDNWQKRANCLQAEVFKYKLYAETLQSAMKLRLAKQQVLGQAAAVDELPVPAASPSGTGSSCVPAHPSGRSSWPEDSAGRASPSNGMATHSGSDMSLRGPDPQTSTQRQGQPVQVGESSASASSNGDNTRSSRAPDPYLPTRVDHQTTNPEKPRSNTAWNSPVPPTNPPNQSSAVSHTPSPQSSHVPFPSPLGPSSPPTRNASPTPTSQAQNSDQLSYQRHSNAPSSKPSSTLSRQDGGRSHISVDTTSQQDTAVSEGSARSVIADTKSVSTSSKDRRTPDAKTIYSTNKAKSAERPNREIKQSSASTSDNGSTSRSSQTPDFNPPHRTTKRTVITPRSSPHPHISSPMPLRPSQPRGSRSLSPRGTLTKSPVMSPTRGSTWPRVQRPPAAPIFSGQDDGHARKRHRERDEVSQTHLDCVSLPIGTEGSPGLASGLSPARKESADNDAEAEERASQCWNEDPDFLTKDEITEWLSGQKPINGAALWQYFQYFDFTGLPLDEAFRELCKKLYMEATGQQADRILDMFGKRYWECNPGSVFGSADIVHIVSYSLVMLNTDVHVAESTSRQSRDQFVHNTLDAIQIHLQPPIYGLRTVLDENSRRRLGGALKDIYSATKSQQIVLGSTHVSAPCPPISGEGLYETGIPIPASALGFASKLANMANGADEDDSELLGPPWVKEGHLSHKYYKGSPEKGTKSETWTDVFAVSQKGELLMFKFGSPDADQNDTVSNGNWREKAQPAGCLQLAHSIAQARPPPGYTNQRPNCVALTLADGSVHFFQAGTDEHMKEWVSTCNYWAARRSKEPLAGDTNMEYGWNRILLDSEPGNAAIDLASIAGDAGRSIIHDWKPPMSSTIASSRDEGDQLEAMENHVSFLEAKLKEHFQLLQPMIALHMPHPDDSAKAQDNWKKRANYLQADVFKYKLYAETIRTAMNLRLAKQQALGQATAVDELPAPAPSPSGVRTDTQHSVSVPQLSGEDWYL